MNTHKCTIMVLEDEDLLLQAITKKMKSLGLEVISCTSGKQAIDYLNNLPELPEAIWLDYYLKDMNGIDFMNQVKNNPKWQDIPVMVVSNSASGEKVTSMLGLGAKKYFLKAEYRLDDLIQSIKEITGCAISDKTLT